MAARARARKTEKPETSEAAGESTDDVRATGRTPRGIWSGSISFGLLQIPVTLYPAEQKSEELHFRQLDKRDLSPVRYERVNATSGEPVEWGDIVKGYELEPDTYVVIEPADLKKANVKATQTVDIQDFVPRDEIDPAFYEAPYFVVPQKRAAKAYVLLREALRHKEAVAVATFVLRTREHLCALMPVGDALMLEVLRFGHELRSAEDMPLPSGGVDEMHIGDRELAMAEQLIDGMMASWKPSKYRDRYHADVRRLIEEKAKTGTTTRHHDEARGAEATNVVDLLDLLKKSVAQTGKGKTAANDDDGAKPAKPTKGPVKAKRRATKRTAAA